MTNLQSTPTLLEDSCWDWKKLIWNPELLPKIKFFLWKCAQNGLPTGESLQHRGVLDVRCKRCGEEESLSHLLFWCNFATKTWELCPWSLPITDHSDTFFRSKLQASFNKQNLPPIGAITNIFPWLCGGLWNAHNQLIFQNKQTSPLEIVSKAISAMREWELAQSLKQQISTRSSAEETPQGEELGIMYCNTDAA